MFTKLPGCPVWLLLIFPLLVIILMLKIKTSHYLISPTTTNARYWPEGYSSSGNNSTVVLTAQYTYTDGRHGLPFKITSKYIELFKKVETNFVSSVEWTVLEEFVFVSAASDNHFLELWKALDIIQQKDPARRVIVYDLGLSIDNIKKLRTFEHVVYREFLFGSHPHHVSRLTYYAWKPLILLDVLATEKVIFWIDSSVRLMSSNYTTLFSKSQQNGGIVLLKPTAHSIYAVTHPSMYRYIPSNLTALKTTMCYSSTIFYVNTRSNFSTFLWWHVLCSLTKTCIAPTDRTSCHFKTYKIASARTVVDKMYKYGDCHRYDMSALNLLLANKFSFMFDRYTLDDDIVTVRRGDIHQHLNQSSIY